MTTISLHPRPPFDFSRSAAIFSTGDPAIRILYNGIFRYTFLTSQGPVLTEVRSSGTVDEPELILSVKSETPVTRTMEQDAARIIARIFSIEDDLLPFYAAVENDPVLAYLSRRLRGVKAPTTPTVFEALTDSIIEQQISLAAARSVENRLIRHAGRQVTHSGMTGYCYPEPEDLAGLSDTVFRSCGLTLRKGEYIRGIAHRITDGDFDPEIFRTMPDTEDIIRELVGLRGVGRWTAELTILRGLHHPDAFPADDVGVRRFISRFYLGGSRITAFDARLFAERWGAWKGFAAYYLEVADHLGMRPE